LVLILHYKTCFNSIWLVAPPVQDTLAYGWLGMRWEATNFLKLLQWV
jgi:hypothetical protein